MGIGVDLGVETKEFGTDSREWLGSAHGTQATRTVTIDADAFIGQNIGGSVLADGDFLPSGVPLAIRGADGLAVPATTGGADGAATTVGHLYSGVTLKAGRNIGVALHEHGKVRTSKIPARAGGATYPAAGAPHIIYLP